MSFNAEDDEQSSSTERLTHWCLGIVGLIPADESIYTLPIAGGGANQSVTLVARCSPMWRAHLLPVYP